MAGTLKRIFGPLALTTTLTTNIHNPASALIKDVIHQIHFSNKTAGAVTISLWLGATGGNAAGTELFTGKVIPANDVYDHYCRLVMTSTDFLVGGSNTPTAVTAVAFGEQQVI